MKLITDYTTIIRTVILLNFIVLISCNNDDIGNEPLPPATQTGSGTFACKVNGVSFIDESNTFFNAFYQFVDGGFYFGIAGEDSTNRFVDVIALASNARQIMENSTYALGCDTNNNYVGKITFTNQLLGSDTCNTEYGFLTISKLDFENKIVSGTFEFDVIDPRDNTIIKIREGRFDTIFTQ